MSETVKIGNSWYVVEDISGIIGRQPDADPTSALSTPLLLLRGGQMLSMPDISDEVIEHIRLLRDPRPVATMRPDLPTAEQMATMRADEAATRDIVDMEPLPNYSEYDYP